MEMLYGKHLVPIRCLTSSGDYNWSCSSMYLARFWLPLCFSNLFGLCISQESLENADSTGPEWGLRFWVCKVLPGSVVRVVWVARPHRYPACLQVSAMNVRNFNRRGEARDKVGVQRNVPGQKKVHLCKEKGSNQEKLLLSVTRSLWQDLDWKTQKTNGVNPTLLFSLRLHNGEASQSAGF